MVVVEAIKWVKLMDAERAFNSKKVHLYARSKSYVYSVVICGRSIHHAVSCMLQLVIRRGMTTDAAGDLHTTP